MTYSTYVEYVKQEFNGEFIHKSLKSFSTRARTILIFNETFIIKYLRLINVITFPQSDESIEYILCELFLFN